MFYQFRQNNSGGSYDIDDDISSNVVVEGVDSDDCYQRAQKIGIYFDGVLKGQDCDCCGDRWYGGDEITFSLDHANEVLTQDYSTFRFDHNVTVIHYLNGDRKYIVNFESQFVEEV